METFKFGPFPVETIFQIKFSGSILVLINMRFKQRMQEIKIGKKTTRNSQILRGAKGTLDLFMIIYETSWRWQH